VNSGYNTSSRFVRFIAVIAASALTGTLFGAVALGLTGGDGWSMFAQHDDRAVQAPVQVA
jgi:hypothetical protein